jgi:hypothetical protein
MIYNSTIIPKNKKCKCGCNREGRIWANGMLKECNARINPPKPIAKVSKKRESELIGSVESLQNLVNDCDRLTSLVVRLSVCRLDGYSECFVCGITDHYKNMQNSHYIKRGNMFLRFDLKNNCRNSCEHCNGNHNINEIPYKEALEKENKRIVEYLESHRNTVHKWTIGELKYLCTELQSKVDLLMTKFN